MNRYFRVLFFRWCCCQLLLWGILCLSSTALAQPTLKATPIAVNWDKVVVISKSTPTLQVVVNPMLQRGSPIHDASFDALKQLGADHVRFVPWLPYPKLAVAELEPPTANKTSWDFTDIDPITTDFLNATAGHSTVMNFSTIPAWLFKTNKPIEYPSDPAQVFWTYTQGTELKDPSGKQLGDYYARLVSWYIRGGFTDENGKAHISGYHYSFPVWEVLNEPDSEHSTTPELYAIRYDAIAQAIHQVSPQTKFMGIALLGPSAEGAPHWFEYFLNRSNHKPGIPLDYISYHFYATPQPAETPDIWQYSFFDQADRFLATVRYIESTRQRLSPETQTDIDEVGAILPTENVPSVFWNAASALYAYLFMELAKQQIEWIGESQLVGYPTQYPSVSMIDWSNGCPNARYWVLKLLKDNFHPGDKLVETTVPPSYSDIAAQAFLTPEGRKLLIVNKRNKEVSVSLSGDAKATIAAVDPVSGEREARILQMAGSMWKMAPFAVEVITWK